MRSLLLGCFVSCLPVMAMAAPQWCPVSPADAATAMGQVPASLTAALDSKPSPMRQVHTEGKLPGDSIRERSGEAEKQLPIMRDAAYAWRAGAGDAYLDLAMRYLNAWVAVYHPDYDPIDETKFDAMIETYAIVAPKMDARSHAAADRLFRTWATGYVRRMDRTKIFGSGPAAKNARSNWQSHRIKLVTLMAVALDDDTLFADARRLFRNQVAANIHPDGTVNDFVDRDAVSYVLYDLQPLLQASLAAKTRGEDWYSYESPTGSSLAKAAAWVKPYATGEKTHQEFVHSIIAFDAKRADAGETGFSGPFDPASAGTFMWTVSALDPSYLPLAQSLKDAAPSFITLCGN